MKSAFTFLILSLLLALFNACNLNTIPEVVPQVSSGFSVSGGDCEAPCEVNFTNSSQNAQSYLWDFGDGIGTSTEANPSYTYTFGGSFNVVLVATGSDNLKDTTSIVVDITEPAKTFNLSLGEAGVDEEGLSVRQLASGNYIVLTKKDNCSDKCMVLYELDKDGQTVWSQDYAYNVFDAPDPRKLRLDPQTGNFIIAGNTEIAGSNIQAYAAFISQQKNVFWDADFGTSSVKDYFLDVAVGSDGNFYFLGYNDGNYKYRITKTNRTGDKVFERTLTNSSNGFSGTIHALPGGGFMVADRGFRLFEIDENGNEVSMTQVGNSDANESVGLIPTSDGGWIYTGESGFDQYTDIYVIKLKSDLTEEWSVTFPDNGWFEYGIDAAEAKDGGFGLLARTDANGFGSADIVLIKLDSNGNQVFLKEFGSGLGRDVEATSDGGFIITGHDNSGAIRVIKTDADGNIL